MIMEKRERIGTLLVVIGVILALASILVFLFVKNTRFNYTVISYAIFGGGFGLLGDGLGRLNSARIAKKNPEKMKLINIEKNDERNVSINEKAAAKTFWFMFYIFAVVLIVLVIMRIDVKALYIVLAAYEISIIFFLLIKLKLYREM